MTYRFFACQLTTGEAIAELSPTSFSGERVLGSDGTMSCELFLGNLNLADRLAVIDNTRPGRMSIAVDRDGVCVGEWIIWKRSRSNDDTPMHLGGSELFTFLTHRLIHVNNFVNVDQMVIGRSIALQGFTNPDTEYWSDGKVWGGGLQMLLPAVANSGITRTMSYPMAEDTHAARLIEVATMDNGFEYTIEPAWDMSSGTRHVSRTFRPFYPMAGVDRAVTLHPVGPGGGSIVSLQADEDATEMFDMWYVLGAAPTSGQGSRMIVTTGGPRSGLVNAGYPLLQKNESAIDITSRAELLARAVGQLAAHNSAVIPPTLTILANGDVPLGSFTLGDRMGVALPASANFPSGYAGTIRLLGWTITPLANGPEILAVTVALEV